jgi:GxxExxY protein
VYEVILASELNDKGLEVQRQPSIPIEYNGIRFVEGFRADLLVERKVIVESKCVESLHNVHRKQRLTCLRLGSFRLGYLLNFGEALMKRGIHRIVNGL